MWGNNDLSCFLYFCKLFGKKKKKKLYVADIMQANDAVKSNQKSFCAFFLTQIVS